MKALKQLDALRKDVPVLATNEAANIMALPLADAFIRIAELTMHGSLTREQADTLIKLVDYKNEAHIRDLRSKYLPDGRTPNPNAPAKH